MENKVKVVSVLLVAIILSTGILILWNKDRNITSSAARAIEENTLWKYQCIDTMKTSRDKAVAWRDREDLTTHIQTEVTAIKEMGANCVALGTPYDAEFLPYLTLWVEEARKQDLHIWFRGNFSEWEGWFNYPKGMTADELFEKTEDFIVSNSALFQDGDIFTAAPEAENGGPFNQVEIDEHEIYREFLIKSYDVSDQAFQEIGKDVVLNWFSMNGGLARRMMDQKTVDALDKTVTIDHYIRTSQEMGEFVDYFNDVFGAQVVIGEFGAPIPEINGSMTDQEQADFIEELLQELYIRRNKVDGINYWILYDGSTAILDQNLMRKPVFDVIEKYFKPAIVRGKVTDQSNKVLDDVPVSIEGGESTTTDENGDYTLMAIEGNHKFSFGDNRSFTRKSQNITVARSEQKSLDITLVPVQIDVFDRVKRIFENFNLWSFFSFR